MSGFTKQRRQRIIDEYLAQTGNNTFKPGEFIDWLADKPDHEAYGAFYALDDAEAARAYRIELARRFVNGLRIVVVTETVETTTNTIITHAEDAPKYFSPPENRHTDGGGYVAYDPTDAASVASFRREAATALGSWKRRYWSALTEPERKALGELIAHIERVADPV
jgi:hypothetical protein